METCPRTPQNKYRYFGGPAITPDPCLVRCEDYAAFLEVSTVSPVAGGGVPFVKGEGGGVGWVWVGLGVWGCFLWFLWVME